MVGAPGSNTEAGPPDGINRLRILGQDLVDRHGMRDQLGVHACFAHAAGDELGVLGAEVDDKHRTVCH